MSQLARTGDKGQRYEAPGLRRDDDQWEVVGWTNDPMGGFVAIEVRARSRFSACRVVDRLKSDRAREAASVQGILVDTDEPATEEDQ